MRFILVTLLTTLLATASFSAWAFDESMNYQPGLNLNDEAAQLTDLIGAHGSQLCAPIAMTHGMAFLRQSGFTQLATVPDMDGDGKADTYRDRIRYFFKTCQSDINAGTHIHEAQACLTNYMAASGFNPFAYIIGPHAINAPQGQPLPNFQHVLTIADVRAAIKTRGIVIMTVGWYDFNPATKTYTRIGGHFFNVYGYDYMNAWGEQSITLQAVNSLVSYTSRAPQNMFDTLQMTAVPADGTNYPSDARFIISGTGFNFVQKTLVEDVIVVVPVNRN